MSSWSQESCLPLPLPYDSLHAEGGTGVWSPCWVACTPGAVSTGGVPPPLPTPRFCVQPLLLLDSQLQGSVPRSPLELTLSPVSTGLRHPS